MMQNIYLRHPRMGAAGADETVHGWSFLAWVPRCGSLHARYEDLGRCLMMTEVAGWYIQDASRNGSAEGST